MIKKGQANKLKTSSRSQSLSLSADPVVQRDEELEISSCNCTPAASLDSGSGVSVFVADDTEMGTQLLADSLRRSHHFKVISASEDGVPLAGLSFEWEPHVALISSSLNRGGHKGLELSRQVRSRFPQAKVVILLDRSTRESVIDAFRAGAQGVFCRTGSLKLLRKCILCVHAGQVWANSREIQFLLESLCEVRHKPLVDARGLKLLSKREEDVLYCVVDGLKNREIAAQLHLSEHTIKNYMFRIFDKLGVSSRVEMILYALSQRSSSSNANLSYEFVRNSDTESRAQTS